MGDIHAYLLAQEAKDPRTTKLYRRDSGRSYTRHIPVCLMPEELQYP
jgi:hypothetical protein